uniref:NADH dehydrogenase subunit 6 n=1 Tax=Ergasilus anchoratus TaxID=342414 RepID=UPI002E78F164|nr:NADH dehydrogenase subunit 6 [Ergasilus anchoratus]UUB71179.1 NADH dehydrogenase subunit 6 [Ergasilus anchoratus]
MSRSKVMVMEMAFNIMLILLMTILTLILYKIKNPFMGSLTLVGMTMLLMMDIGVSTSQWISYLLMLLFLGGMMVMFLYVTSVMTTLKFNLPKLSVTSLWILLLALMLWANQIEVYSTNKFMPLSDFFNLDSTMVVLFVFIYLLISLLVVVGISKKFEGSLKSKING